jgi:predicted nucleic acid-binding protein
MLQSMQRLSLMKATVDANILFACLIKDSATRRLLFNPALTLFAPQFIIEELIHHILEIKKKSGLPDADLLRLVEKVFSQVILVPDKDLIPFLPAAASLISDSKDWLYLSCALSKDTVIWSNDGHFTSQNRVKVLTTKELISIIGSL